MKGNKRTAGFTLVELIVVIAILGILAGVGTVGYSGYVKSAAKNADKVTVGNVIRALETANNSGFESFAVENQYAEGLTIPVGYVVISNEALDASGNYTITLSPGTVSYDETLNQYVNSGVGTNDLNSVLGKAISAAYGNSYGNDIQLRYDGWNANLNSSFFSSAGDMVGAVDTMGDNVLGLLDTLGRLNLGDYGIFYSGGTLTLKTMNWRYPWNDQTTTVKVISQDYDDSAALLLAFATEVSGLTKAEFVSDWDNLSTETEAFGLESAGREHYSAARAAYNNCFATYVRSYKNTFTLNGTEYTHACEAHASDIAGYGEDAMALVSDKLGSDAAKYLKDVQTGTKFPQAVCDSVLAGGVDNPNDFKTCKACKALYQEYKSSEQDKEDATNFYDTMVTGAKEGPAIYDPSNPNAFFQWMTASAETFSDMYDEVDRVVGEKSAVVLVVNYANGVLDIEVAPFEADNR